MRSWKDMSGRRKLAIGATVIAVLALAGFFVTQRFQDADKDTAAQPRAQETAVGDDARPAGKPLELGDVAKISSNYSVAVTDATLYEGSNRQVMVATIKAEYIGTEEGEPWADLIVEFADADARASDESDCPAGLGGSSDQPVLKAGDVETHVACIDLPTSEVEDGRIYVEESLSEGERVSWSTDEAVTKAMPAPPRAPVDRAPDSQPQAPRQPASNASNDESNDEFCEEHEEDVEDYKENIDDFEKLAEQGDEDDQEEFEEWKDAMDKNVENYEKVC